MGIEFADRLAGSIEHVLQPPDVVTAAELGQAPTVDRDLRRHPVRWYHGAASLEASSRGPDIEGSGWRRLGVHERDSDETLLWLTDAVRLVSQRRPDARDRLGHVDAVNASKVFIERDRPQNAAVEPALSRIVT